MHAHVGLVFGKTIRDGRRGLSRWLLSVLAACSMQLGLAEAAAAQNTLSLPPLKAGATEVTGFVDPPAGDVRRVVIEIRRETPPSDPPSACSKDFGMLVDRTVATSIDAETGRFSAKLAAGLAKDDCVVVSGASASGTPVDTKSVQARRVGAADQPEAVKPPELRVPLRAGSRIVSGWVPAGKDVTIDKVVVTVRRSRDDRHSAEVSASETNAAAPGPTQGQAGSNPGGSGPVQATPAVPSEPKRTDAPGVVFRAQTAEIGADGGFNVALPEPIMDGQDVEVAVFAGDSRLSTATAVVEDPGNWGRVRAYFAGGVIVSQAREEFSKQDFVLALVLDSAWYQPTPPQLILPQEDRACTMKAWLAVKTGGAAASGAPRPETRRPDNPSGQITRLETFDVDGLDAADRDSVKNYRRLLAKTDPCWKSRWWLRVQVNSFLDVRMTALPVQAEAADASSAAPAASSTASATPAPGEEFVDARKAALIHLGFYLPFYGRTTTWSFQGHRNALFIAPVVRAGFQTISQQDSALKLSGEDNDGVYWFYSYGLGIGHYKLSDTKDRAPELISYLHVTHGPFENFRNASDTPGFLPQRWAIEGRMKIPETPLQIGLDANLGRGPDSVAFTFATRFDIGELFGKLKTFKP